MKIDQSSPKSACRPSRRDFLAGTAAAATAAAAVTAFTIVPRYVLGGPGNTPPSETVNIAIIGAGGQGRTNAQGLLGHDDARIVAVCDVNEEADYERFYYKGKAGRGPVLQMVRRHNDGRGRSLTVGEYVDFRQMLEKEKDAIDAVLVATPDHNHYIASLTAIQHGKHVYCEKPLAHSVAEVRLLTQAARRAGVATQMGNQGHSEEGIRLTREWIQDGAIGPVTEVHGWTHAGAGEWHGWMTEAPAERPAIPAGLNWDLWLGPVKKRPYHPAYHPYNWRGWWAFGTGAIGDMACHNLDPAFYALDLGQPETIQASCCRVSDEVAPLASLTQYTFPARGEMPPVKMYWYDGGIMPPRPDELEPGRDLDGRGNGILFVGTKGKMMAAGWAGTPRIIPETRMRSYKRPAKTIERVGGHHRDWLNACKGGKPASGNFDYSGPMTEVVLLGAVAQRFTEKTLYWDAAALKVTNAPEADSIIRPEFHNGWTL
ncbi:MAG: Gfo/Idh/MocA family oxidoreductase [Sedimentisphaerales bacterium]|nr:Gfo/Idh/MocA family oxidoreductase [Sedimentisphaerales bacterium]